jgi:site-specific recombinase XerD
MPYQDRDTYRRRIPEYLNTLVARRLSDSYIYETRRVLTKAHETLVREGRRTVPRDISSSDVLAYLDSIQGRSKYREQCLITLGQFLKYCGNPVVSKMGLRFPKDQISRANWLQPEQISYLRTQAQGEPKLNLILELGFNCFARRVEIQRLTTADARACLNTGLLTLRGKGPMGGKARTFYCHPDSPAVIEEYLDYRAGLLSQSCSQDPGSLLIYMRGKEPRPYTKNGMDRLLRRFSEAIGIDFSYHTMRRSGLREIFKAGVELPTIQRLAGHESVDMTVRYLGIRLSDTQAAMEKYSDYQRQAEQSGPSQIVQ